MTRNPQDESTQIAGNAASFSVGRLINRTYKIEKPLGVGAMGQVFLATNVLTDDTVAIKVLRDDLSLMTKTVDRFLTEARTLSSLHHRSIVRYHHAAQDEESNRPFMIMEYIEGISLAEYFADRECLEENEVFDLAMRLAHGFHVAHKANVIHGDISPSNVMLRNGKLVDPVVIDFGAAQNLIGNETTIIGDVFGKLDYAAPEKLGLFQGEMGPKSDIYSLGIVLAEAARGRPKTSGTSIVEAVASRREIPDLSDVPMRLQQVLTLMLEPNPADRPDSMEALTSLINDMSSSGDRASNSKLNPKINNDAMVTQLISSSPISLADNDGILTVRNNRQSCSHSPEGLEIRLVALRRHLDQLIGEGQEKQLGRDILQRLQHYANALNDKEPLYILLDGPMAFLRGALSDDYIAMALDEGFAEACRLLIAKHDELCPYLVPNWRVETKLPEFGPDATPELGIELLESVEFELDDPTVDERVLDALEPFKDYFTLASEDLNRRSGLVRRAFSGLGGLLGILVAAVGIHTWATSTAGLVIVQRLQPILDRVIQLTQNL